MILPSEMLRGLSVSGSVYFCDTLTPPWERRFRDEARASFHIVRRGTCRLTWERGSELLDEGDFVLVKSGIAHTLTSADGGQHACTPTLMLCGYCCFHTTPAAVAIDSLPPIVTLRAAEIASMPWFAGTIEHLSDAWIRSENGGEVVIDRLTEILMIELVRMQVSKFPSERYGLALSDAQVTRALHLLHSQPELPWTIEQLARQVALSRAALAKRFKDALGQTVFQYLTRIRIHRAEVLLRSSRKPLSSIAHQVGYGSDLTFSKAFKRETGMTPGRFRRC